MSDLVRLTAKLLDSKQLGLKIKGQADLAG
jgi:hypothetical protein